jgi:ABC-type multidrug transport system ATPase subunit
MITAHNLVKAYDGLTAVDGIDFEIRKGECYGFLGPNGAGKTTVMRIISCFMPPTRGSVSVFGMDVTEKPSEIKARIGIMPQDNNLDPDLSALENLMVYARYFDIRKKDAARLARVLLEFVELQDKAKAKIDQLSGGMKHRLLLARALVNNPEVLILDEPTTGLDPHSRRAVWDKLNHLKSRNTTLLLTTHYMEEAERLCHRVGIIDEGQIRAEGTRRELVDLVGQRDRISLTATGDLAAAASMARSVPGVESATVHEGGLDLLATDGRSVLPHLLAALSVDGIAVRSVEVIEPDLEAVFLHLTGKALRD